MFYPGIKLHQTPQDLPICSSQNLFGNDRPLVLDLGCGKGEFVLALARDPDKNFVGIDRHWKSLYVAVNCVQELNLTNVQFVRQDLRQGLVKVLDQSVQEVYLLFPPPPTKQGLIKRDFVSNKLVGEIVRVLVSGGRLIFVSDKKEYFADKKQLISKFEQLECTEISLNNINTRFSHFWQNLGINYQIVEFVKL